MKKLYWKRMGVHRDPETGHRVVTLFAKHGEQPVYAEEHFDDSALPDGDLVLMHEAYWVPNGPRCRTVEQALGLNPDLPQDTGRYAPAADLMSRVKPEPQPQEAS